ncbi:MAG: TldD/PmbA family protein [Candidatus Lambdaproteobacteria bacterium]|nr:TldD/PmbA family protein [Candidatus Lambdaproteobacteria bacterium]
MAATSVTALPSTALERADAAFRAIVPRGLAWSLRLVDDRTESITVRQGVVQPLAAKRSLGAMVTVAAGGGVGYGATGNLGAAGLASALEHARAWARTSAAYALVQDGLPLPAHQGEYENLGQRAWSEWTLADKLTLLHDLNRRMRRDARIVDWQALLGHRLAETLLVTSAGGRIRQRQRWITSGLLAVANAGGETQRRSWGFERGRQGGLEQLDTAALADRAGRTAEEALVLLGAPNCPSGSMDLLLMPSQMILQIHESIGHPLELDRLLGDERNYAGTSFVTPDMFGSYRYGSPLLNVTFDPTRPEQLASFGYDDEGTPARREYIIREGILLRPLGGATSQRRAGVSGVANARASDWNRPPIDRMANLNLEPGDKTLPELIGSIERGVWMDTNRSWSIDDSRNKFQFGCEAGRLIEHGELKGWVRNPNYRGISAVFWRNLAAVGDASTFEVLGEPSCGKGEPNQMIHVGHASPACVFTDVDVFGGA